MTNLFKRALDVGMGNPTLNPRQRMATAAEALSLAGDLQAHLDVAEASIVALVNVLYAVDADQRPANYDRVTGRILIPVPWGESGWKRWGLRHWEGTCLRRLLLDRVGHRRRLPALFDYNQYARQWHINVSVYPDSEAALQWLRKDGPSLQEWRSIVTDYRAQAHARMQRLRG